MLGTVARRTSALTQCAEAGAGESVVHVLGKGIVCGATQVTGFEFCCHGSGEECQNTYGIPDFAT